MATYINDMRSLATYRDSPICVTDTTGGGNRFHGYRMIKFGDIAWLLKEHQKNATFTFTARARIQVSTRDMTDHNTCRGVIDPDTITSAPHNLRELRRPKCSGAVTKHVYEVPAEATDTLLHGLYSHPTVLDVWLINHQVWVFRMKDRHIRNGLIQHITTVGAPQACKARLRLKRSAQYGRRSRARTKTSVKPSPSSH